MESASSSSGGEELLLQVSGEAGEEGEACRHAAAPATPGGTSIAAPCSATRLSRDAVLLASLPYVAGWTCVSILTLLYNKHLYRTGAFPFPLTLVLVHQVSLGCLLWAVRALAPEGVLKWLMPGAGHASASSLRDSAQAFLPIALLQAVAMASQNHALQLSSAHFVVMVNAVKPVLVSLLQVAFGLITLNCVHLKIVSVISTGVLIAVAGEVEVTSAGLSALVVAQLSEGVRVVLVQRSLSGRQELDAATLLSYSAPACALVLAPAAFYFEVARMDVGTFAELGATMLGASIALAVLVNVMGVLVIQKTDALVLAFAGIIKDFIGIFVSAYCFAATIMPSQILGYAIAVLFMNIYRESRQREAALASDGLCAVLVGLVCPSYRKSAGSVEPEPDGGGSTCARTSSCHQRHRGVLYGVLLLLLCVAVAAPILARPRSHFARALVFLVLGSEQVEPDISGAPLVFHEPVT